MTWAFRSVGTISTAFNATTTPGSPTGYQAGDLLLVCAWCTASSVTIPDLTSQGFTKLSSNSLFHYVVIYGKVAVGSDAMPTFQLGPDFQGSYCLAYTGGPGTIVTDQAATERGVTVDNGCSFGGFALPSNPGIMAFSLGMRNPGSANGVTWGTKTNYTNRATQVQDGKPHAIMLDWIQSAATSSGITSISSSPVDSAGQTAASETIFLTPDLSAGFIVGDDEFPARVDFRIPDRRLHEFWQVSDEIRTAPPAVMPTSAVDFPLPQSIRRSQNILEINLNLIDSVLFRQDRVLAPVSWGYRWPDPLSRMPLALRAENEPLNILELTALTTYAPYIEYNFPVPLGPRQPQRSFEAFYPLELLGKDVVYGAPGQGVLNLPWEVPRGRPNPVENLSCLSSGLALTQTINILPPPGIGNVYSDQPVPRAPRRPVMDFVEDMPNTILRFLTTPSPFQGSQDLPPKDARRIDFSFSFTPYPILLGADVLPFGLQSFDLPVRPSPSTRLMSFEETSNFITSAGGGTQPPITGQGKHMGRVILPAVFQGEGVVLDQFDFLSGLGAGELISAVQAAAAVYSGTDANPNSIIVGVSASGSKCLVQVNCNIPGNIYYVIARVATNFGQTLDLSGYLTVVPYVP